MPKLDLGRLFKRRAGEDADAEPKFDTPDFDYSDGYERPENEYDDYPPFDDGYGGFDDGYGPEGDYVDDPDGYDPDGYGPDGYDPNGYDPDGEYADRGGFLPGPLATLIDYVMNNDWVTWALLLVLPPLGIWLLWRRGMLNRNGRLMFSLLSAIWLVAILLLIFVRPQNPDEEIMPQTIARQNPQETVEPTATPVPEVSDADAVYTVGDGAFYHLLTDCRLIDGKQTARVARATAQEQNMMSCPYCAAGGYGVVDAIYMTIDTPDVSNQLVYCLPSDESFHIDLDCPVGIEGAHLVGLKEALLMNKTACPSCCAAAARRVYCTADGTYYHVDDDCSGMRNARQVTYAEARVLGKVRCPKCIGGTPEVNATASAGGDAAAEDTDYYVFATKNGKYYHIDEHCTGMLNAQRVKLADMLSSGRPACPVCCTAVEMTVYASHSSPYYHSYPTCSGLTDAISGPLVTALAAGLTRCPVCWLAVEN